jgi:hypothetical protein
MWGGTLPARRDGIFGAHLRCNPIAHCLRNYAPASGETEYDLVPSRNPKSAHVLIAARGDRFWRMQLAPNGAPRPVPGRRCGTSQDAGPATLKSDCVFAGGCILGSGSGVRATVKGVSRRPVVLVIQVEARYPSRYEIVSSGVTPACGMESG